MASFTGDGGYDQDGVYASVAERYPEAAVPSDTAETAPTRRDRCQVVGIERGVAGYHPLRLCDGPTRRRMAAQLNAALAVPPTPQQAIALLIGSRFGWEMPGADPDSYQEGRGMTPANYLPPVR